jgi:hypothetical protein
MNDLDNELSRTMRHHAENLSAAPLAFDDVRGKATSIRRRRQVATGIGALAAIAVIVPTAMFASQNVLADNEIDPGVSGTPTVIDSNGTDATEGPGPTMGADSGALDVTGLPTGEAPSGVVTGGDLAAAQVDGALVRWTPEGVAVEADGQTFGPYPTSHGIARNPAATAVAWTTDEGAVMAWATGASEPFVVIDDVNLADLRVGAVTGTFCAPTDEPSECLYYVSGYDMDTGETSMFTVTPQGDVANVDPDQLLITVRDATDDGRVIGHTSIDDLEPGSCSALLDPADTGSTPLWETCNHTLDTFSPNGDYVLASDAYGDGIGSGVIAIYDAADGTLLAERKNKSGGLIFYNDATWEDETHVLLSVFQDGKWSIVRMDVNGAMEFAVEPQKGDEMQVPWHFETT